MKDSSSSRFRMDVTKSPYFAAIVVNILPFSNQLNKDAYKYWLPYVHASMEEKVRIQLMYSIGALIGCIIFGWITIKSRPKNPFYFLATIELMACLLCIYPVNLLYLTMAQLMKGIVGGGGSVTILLYLLELASDRNRGALLSTFALSRDIAALWYAFISVTFKQYVYNKSIAVQFGGMLAMCLFVALLPFIPKPPSTVDKPKNSQDGERQRLLEKGIRNGSIDETSSGRPVTKAIFIGILASLTQFCATIYKGYFNYFSHIYIHKILQTLFKTSPTISDNCSAIFLAALPVLVSLLIMNSIDRIGRKRLFVVSVIGTGVGLLLYGANSYTHDFYHMTFKWILMGTFQAIHFIASQITFVLPFIIIPEIIPDKLKNNDIAICLAFYWLFDLAMFHIDSANRLMWFFRAKDFSLPKCSGKNPFCLEFLGTRVPYPLFIPAAICFIGAIFFSSLLPETKQKSRREIQQSL